MLRLSIRETQINYPLSNRLTPDPAAFLGDTEYVAAIRLSLRSAYGRERTQVGDQKLTHASRRCFRTARSPRHGKLVDCHAEQPQSRGIFDGIAGTVARHCGKLSFHDRFEGGDFFIHDN